MRKHASKSIMIQGTASHAGKSVTAAAICRILKQDGYSVCPFKSQNMALNSYVTAGGGEMGRAQVVQAEACGLAPEVYMNPILIKPTADTKAQIIFMGKVVSNMDAVEYDRKKITYLNKIKEILDDLKKRFDFIVIEGAGSPAEINLLKNDIVNMRTAVISRSPVILVGDIDRGGVFAGFYGTVKLLPLKFRRYIKGLLVNKFRGDISILRPGNDFISRKLKIPVIGTIPYFKDIYIEEEDSVNLEREKSRKHAVRSTAGNGRHRKIMIGVVYLPHISNFTDFNAFEMEKEASVVYIKNRRELKNLRPHMIIIPGSKSTISDLMYLRGSGLEEEIRKQHRNGSTVFGICGGFQILGNEIADKFRSESPDIGHIDGMGLMNMDTEFLQYKNTHQVEFEINKEIFRFSPELKQVSSNIAGYKSKTMKGYEIHMGISKSTAVRSNELVPLFRIKSRENSPVDIDDGFMKPESSTSGAVFGSYIHGVFNNYFIRKLILDMLRKKNNIKSDNNTDRPLSYEVFKQKQYDRLADVFRENIDMDLFYRILKDGL